MISTGNRISLNINNLWDKNTLFGICSFLALSLVSLSFVLEEWLLLFIPIGAIVAYGTFAYPKLAFFSFFAILPFSIEVYFSNGLGSDLPSEPLILLFFIFSILFFARQGQAKLPMTAITLFILLHLIWICFTAIFATMPFVSFKFLIAKLWYILPFYFWSQHILNTKANYDRWIKWFFIGLGISIIYVMLRHLTKGFSFDSIGWAVSPIYRNHVNYATLLTIALPLCFYKITHSTYRASYTLFLVLLLVAVYYSYTRAAMGVTVIMLGAALMLRYRLLFFSGIISLFIAAGILGYMVSDNEYLKYAPEYETTVAHQKFDNLIEATYELEDISTMERVHRWVAGFNMWSGKPIIGHGPNNFSFTYKAHTVNSFKTYVSDNPDRSGVHNYYLMIAVEQGVVGLIIWLLLLLSAIYIGEKKYHKAQGARKTIIMVATLIIVNIMVITLINDLIEAVKVGPFLFIALGIINRK